MAKRKHEMEFPGRHWSCWVAMVVMLFGLAIQSEGTDKPPSQPLIVMIDSGISSERPEFRDRFLVMEEAKIILPAALRGGAGKPWTGWDFVDGDAEPQDRTGHGTHVAGLVAGELGPATENSPRLVMFRTGDRQHELAAVAAAFEAVMALRKAGFDIPVVLCAFDYRKTAQDGDGYERFAVALRKVLDSGSICVCAAGNGGMDLDSASDGAAQYQVAFSDPAMITVAACSDEGHLLADSNYGAKSVALAAPGFGALSAAREGGQTALSGSSQAAAGVAGRLARHAASSGERDAKKLRAWLLGQVKVDPSLVGRVTSAGFLPPVGLAAEESE